MTVGYGSWEDELIAIGQAEARHRLAVAINGERRTSHLPPSCPTREGALEELRNAETWAAEWKV